MSTVDFFQSSRGIVESFLNSVIAIDDQLYFGSPIENVVSDTDEFDAIVVEDTGLGHVEAVGIKQPATKSEAKHQLNYQDLSLAFAKYGINCCAFKPDNNRFESIDIAAAQITKSAQRADITILDWSMDDQFSATAGTLAQKSIQSILKEDKTQQGRLRLVVIYTAENPDHVATQVHDASKVVDAETTLIGRNVTFKDRNLEFCQISVIQKSVDVEELCEVVISLVTELTTGLLSNAALASIGELRNKTHHILHSFNRHLDPAYLSHIICLKSSEEARESAHEVAFDYATDIISEEFKSNLQISQTLKEHLNLDRLQKWVELKGSQQSDVFDFLIDGVSHKITTERFNKLLEVTQQEELNKVLAEDPPIKSSRFKKIQIKLAGVEHFPHESLSAIECKRRDVLSLIASEHLPNIKQGTILKDDTSYYLCMQPLCDTVRIFEDRNFLFLKIDKVETEKFSHVLKDETGNFLKLKITPDSKSLHVFKFPPDTVSRTVKCTKLGSQLRVAYKQSDNSVVHLSWVGELKGNIAQAIANDLSSKISRVGLDTNEWLRAR